MYKNYFELLNDIKFINKELDVKQQEVVSILKENGILSKEINNDIIKLSENKKQLIKQFNKITNYGDIEVSYDRDYDRKIIIVKFKNGTKKSYKKKWLKYNNLPYKYTNYVIDDEYDCTGEAVCSYVEYKNNKVIITTCLDL